MSDDILKTIANAYGSLDDPDWRSVARRYDSHHFSDFAKRLGAIGGGALDTSDVNTDTSHSFYTAKDFVQLTVRLSAVGPYACVHNENGVFYDTATLAFTTFGMQIAQLLDEFNYTLLDYNSLRETVLFNNKLHTVYSVVFSTDECIDCAQREV